MAQVLQKDNLTKKTDTLKQSKVASIKDFVVRARFVRHTPDKLRLLANLVKGKKIDDALNTLRFSEKTAAKPLSLCLKSALAQVKDKGLADQVIIKTIIIDEGPRLKRRRIIHRGRATTILKRRSHIAVVLEEQRKSEARSTKSETEIEYSRSKIKK